MKIFFNEGMKEVKKFLTLEEIYVNDSLYKKIIFFLSRALNYEEEGERIKPNLFLGNGIKNVIKIIPNKYVLKINEVALSDLNFDKLIKSLVPFCKNEWYVYIDINEKIQRVEYGVIKGFSGPQGLTISELIFDEEMLDVDGNIVSIEIINSLEIHLKGLRGNRLTINFRMISEETVSVSETISNVSADIVSSIDLDHRPNCRKVINKLLNIAYKRVSGTICMIVKENYDCENNLTTDGIWLKEPIDLMQQAIDITIRAKNIDITAYDTYYSLTELFIEMLNTDGVTILDNKGRIIAYNVFVKSSKESIEITGGARKRAAKSLVRNAIPEMLGVYFQSQDGEVTYERVNK